MLVANFMLISLLLVCQTGRRVSVVGIGNHRSRSLAHWLRILWLELKLILMIAAVIIHSLLLLFQDISIDGRPLGVRGLRLLRLLHQHTAIVIMGLLESLLIDLIILNQLDKVTPLLLQELDPIVLVDDLQVVLLVQVLQSWASYFIVWLQLLNCWLILNLVFFVTLLDVVDVMLKVFNSGF